MAAGASNGESCPEGRFQGVLLQHTLIPQTPARGLTRNCRVTVNLTLLLQFTHIDLSFDAQTL